MTTEPPQPRPPATNVPDWVREHYALVDANAVDTYVERFAPDVELRFASHPPVHGREAARVALAAGHAAHDMQHTIVGVFEDGDTTVVEFDVVYTYRDGRVLHAPSLTAMHRGPDGLFDSIRVYVDQHFPDER
jgi:ketosteroid isomerase-like protein